MDWELQKLSPVAGKFIGQGATSVVFEHKTNADCVVKIPFVQASALLQQEADLLLDVARKGTSQALVRLHAGISTGYLVLTPRFKKLDLEPPFNASLFSTLIEYSSSPLRILHEAGYAHCDIRPNNLMLTLDGSAMALVDLGAARKLVATGAFCHGSLFFASNRVLDSLTARYPDDAEVEAKEEELVFEVQDDLTSLVRCFLLLTTSGKETWDQLLGLGMSPSKVKSWWSNFEAKCPWAGPMLSAADEANYAKLSSLFKTRHLGVITE
jgi:serine/threonine protein kinase